MQKKRIKNPIVWFQYLCWNIQFWMSGQSMAYPIWLRKLLLRRYPAERHGASWRMIKIYKAANPNYVPKYRPLPWYVGECALGPFYHPWRRLGTIVRKFTGGRSHRCEFTDKELGALYGGKEGGFMNELFEQFIQNIPDDID
jgi:hypothetical protein